MRGWGCGQAFSCCSYRRSFGRRERATRAIDDCVSRHVVGRSRRPLSSTDPSLHRFAAEAASALPAEAGALTWTPEYRLQAEVVRGLQPPQWRPVSHFVSAGRYPFIAVPSRHPVPPTGRYRSRVRQSSGRRRSPSRQRPTHPRPVSCSSSRPRVRPEPR